MVHEVHLQQGSRGLVGLYAGCPVPHRSLSLKEQVLTGNLPAGQPELYAYQVDGLELTREPLALLQWLCRLCWQAAISCLHSTGQLCCGLVAFRLPADEQHSKTSTSATVMMHEPAGKTGVLHVRFECASNFVETCVKPSTSIASSAWGGDLPALLLPGCSDSTTGLDNLLRFPLASEPLPFASASPASSARPQ